jgi:hypothetical protein
MTVIAYCGVDRHSLPEYRQPLPSLPHSPDRFSGALRYQRQPDIDVNHVAFETDRDYDVFVTHVDEMPDTRIHNNLRP